MKNIKFLLFTILFSLFTMTAAAQYTAAVRFGTGAPTYVPNVVKKQSVKYTDTATGEEYTYTAGAWVKSSNTVYPTPVNNVLPTNNAVSLRNKFITDTLLNKFYIDFNGVSYSIGSDEIFAGTSFANIPAVLKIGGKFRLINGTDTTEITKVNATTFNADEIRGYVGSVPPTYISSGTNRINLLSAVWKNPNINTITNEPVNFIYQHGTWKPEKNYLSAFDFGAKGDSITDDAPALRNLIAYYAGKTCYIDNPPTAYLIGSSLGYIPDSTKIRGESKAKTKITRGYNGGYMLTLGDNTGLDHLHLDGNSAGYTGGGISIEGTAGNQSIEHCKIINFTGGTPLYYDATAGSRSVLQHCEIFRIDGTAGNNFFAIEIQDLLVANGAPRVFDDIQTGGYNTINTGGCSNLFVSNSPVFHSYFSENSRNVCFSNVRFSASVSQTLRGTGSMIGSSVGSPIVLAPGAAWNLGPSFFNNSVVDSTTSPGANLIFSRELISFTPEFRNNGTPIVLGTGSVLGQYQRMGNMMVFTVRLITNLATTTMSAGQLQFTLPKVANANISFQVNISGRMTQGGNIWRINGTISSNSNVVNLERDVSGAVTSTSPANIATNAIVLQVSGYILL